MRAARITSVFILLIALSSYAFAAQKTFIRDYTYEASELDDKISCQSIALEQVKRLLLEEMGTYVESSTTVKDYQLDHDKITTLTAGIVRTKILQESWDGKTYWIKARLSADSDEVAEAIAKLKDNQETVNDLKDARREAFDALAEVERLKSALAKAEANPAQKSRYDESVRRLQATDSLERGQSFMVAGDYEEAVEAYNQVIALKPDDAKGYGNLAAAYFYLGNYKQAYANFNRAAKFRPDNHYLAKNRNIAYKMMKTPNQAISVEKHFPLKQDTVRVQHTYHAPAQTHASHHQLASGVKQERARVSQHPQQKIQKNYNPAVKTAMLQEKHQEKLRQEKLRQDKLLKQQAQIASAKSTSSVQQAKAQKKIQVATHPKP
ncbi:MAG: hypothetical protein CSYNP_03314 [Syntrophus sp. SKADARSKE-3]|nr:hypothetical protein [Syntrophus sp. SKADARSKE-3]